MRQSLKQNEAGFALYAALGFVVLISGMMAVLQAQLQRIFVPPPAIAQTYDLQQITLSALEQGQALTSLNRSDASADAQIRCRWDKFRASGFAAYSHQLTQFAPTSAIVFIQPVQPLGSDINWFLITACAYDDHKTRNAQAIWYYSIHGTPNWVLVSLRQF